MTRFTICGPLAGVGATLVGLILQAIGRVPFARHKRDDSKELA